MYGNGSVSFDSTDTLIQIQTFSIFSRNVLFLFFCELWEFLSIPTKEITLYRDVIAGDSLHVTGKSESDDSVTDR